MAVHPLTVQFSVAEATGTLPYDNYYAVRPTIGEHFLQKCRTSYTESRPAPEKRGDAPRAAAESGAVMGMMES